MDPGYIRPNNDIALHSNKALVWEFISIHLSSEFQYRCLCDRKILALDLLSDGVLGE